MKCGVQAPGRDDVGEALEFHATHCIHIVEQRTLLGFVRYSARG